MNYHISVLPVDEIISSLPQHKSVRFSLCDDPTKFLTDPSSGSQCEFKVNKDRFFHYVNDWLKFQEVHDLWVQLNLYSAAVFNTERFLPMFSKET